MTSSLLTGLHRVQLCEMDQGHTSLIVKHATHCEYLKEKEVKQFDRLLDQYDE